VGDEPAGELTWHSGRACAYAECVEVAAVGETVLVRSSVTPRLTLTITRAEWQAFLAGAKEGLFDHL